MAAQLALADEFWLAIHDQTGGRPSLQPGPLGSGLAAALAIELVFTNWIVSVSTTDLYLHPDAHRYSLPGDRPGGEVVSYLLQKEAIAFDSQSRHGLRSPVGIPLRDYFEYFRAGRAESAVLERLDQQELLAWSSRRTGMFGPHRDIATPANFNISHWPAQKIRDTLLRGDALSQQELALAGLFKATGTAKKLLQDIGSHEFNFLATQTKAAMQAPVKQLILAVEQAMGRIVMTR